VDIDETDENDVIT